eukprot:scaffold3864_cov248-Pinguiococcus_pyrenoidosus.AAC.7
MKRWPCPHLDFASRSKSTGSSLASEFKNEDRLEFPKHPSNHAPLRFAPWSRTCTSCLQWVSCVLIDILTAKRNRCCATFAPSAALCAFTDP